MGLNVGAIYVRAAPELTQARVHEFIRAHWLALGAKESKDDPLSFEPLSLDKTGRLALLVTPPGPDAQGESQWIAVYDSERYSADAGLAFALAKRFDTDVWLYEIGEVSNQAYAKRYGTDETVVRAFDEVVERAETFPYPVLYFNHLRRDVPAEDLAGLLLLAFEGIPHRPDARYSGPSPAQELSNELVARAEVLAAAFDASGLLPMASDPHVLYDVICPAIDHANLKNPEQAAFVVALAPAVLERSRSHCREEMLEAALRVGDKELFERAIQDLPGYTCSILESRATQLGTAGEPAIAFALLEGITHSPGAKQTCWNNAVFFLLSLLEHPDVSVERRDALLEGARRIAPTNPYIFHNLACAYAKLGRLDAAIEAVQGAVKYGYAHLDKVKADTDLVALHDDPRFAAAFDSPVGVTSIDHLVVGRRGRKLLAPALGLYLTFDGTAAAPALAEVLAGLSKELPPMFAHYRKAGHSAFSETKKGKVTRDLNLLRKLPKSGHLEVEYASEGDDASDLEVAVDLEKGFGYLLLHLPLSLAGDPEALFARLVEYARALPFVTGHAGLTLATGQDTDAQTEALRVVEPYLGLTVPEPQTGYRASPDRIVPGWLTFLGPKLAAKAGDLASGLPPGVFAELPHGGVVLRAATSPIVGVCSAPVDVGALPAIVRTLGPMLGNDLRTEPGKLEAKRQASLAALKAR